MHYIWKMSKNESNFLTHDISSQNLEKYLEFLGSQQKVGIYLEVVFLLCKHSIRGRPRGMFPTTAHSHNKRSLLLLGPMCTMSNIKCEYPFVIQSHVQHLQCSHCTCEQKGLRSLLQHKLCYQISLRPAQYRLT